MPIFPISCGNRQVGEVYYLGVNNKYYAFLVFHFEEFSTSFVPLLQSLFENGAKMEILNNGNQIVVLITTSRIYGYHNQEDFVLHIAASTSQILTINFPL